MQSYDVLMLLVLVAAGLWGYWKGFVWQLASLASIFFSYFLAFGLRVQVAKLIDADPPWNMFAAMGIVYLLSSLVIWIGTGFSSAVLEGFKLKDFDRQIGATFGVAKGMIFCLLITFFAVTLLGTRQQENICNSYSGRFIAKMLKSSGGLIPQEMAAVIDPFLTPFQEKLEGHHEPAEQLAQQPTESSWPQPDATVQPTWQQAQAWAEQGAAAWQQAAYAAQQYQQQQAAYGYGYQPVYAPQQYPYQPPSGYYYPPQYDPRYGAPQYAPPAGAPRYQPAPQYHDPRYPPANYADPRYQDPRAWQQSPAAAGYYPPAPQQPVAQPQMPYTYR